MSENSREYKIVIGSKAFFDSQVKLLEGRLIREDGNFSIKTFLELVRFSDECRHSRQDFFDDDKASIMLVKNDNYGVDFGDIRFTEGSTEVVYYNQADARWGNLPYGKTGTIARSACGPTSLAMVVSSLTDRIIEPPEMVEWAYKNGYRAEGNGSYHSLIPEGAKHFGLNVEGAAYNEEQKIVDALASGKLVIAIMTKGHFTNGGHYIVLRGVTAEGKILVADSASLSRSEREWDLSLILGELRRDAGAGGPLWIID